jgi:hypothetical protein
MPEGRGLPRAQLALDAIMRKWWLYLLLLFLFFLPPYSSRDYDPRDSVDVISAVLMNPLIFQVPNLMPIAKAVPALLVVGLVVLGDRMKPFVNAYAALLYGALAIFQQSGWTASYGFVVVTGNVVLVSIVALFWGWELFSGANDFRPRRIPSGRWWCAPLALFAFLSPVDAITLEPDFNLLHMLTNEAGLTLCMMTPFMLSMLVLFYPTVNLALLRVTSFVGILFGIVNMIVWFLLSPSGWWMGVLHIPLLVTSVYAFLIGQGMGGRLVLGRAAGHS